MFDDFAAIPAGSFFGVKGESAGGVGHAFDKLFEELSLETDEARRPAGFKAFATAGEDWEVAPIFHQMVSEEGNVGPIEDAWGEILLRLQPVRPETTPGFNAELNGRGFADYELARSGRNPGVRLLQLHFSEAHSG